MNIPDEQSEFNLGFYRHDPDFDRSKTKFKKHDPKLKKEKRSGRPDSRELPVQLDEQKDR